MTFVPLNEDPSRIPHVCTYPFHNPPPFEEIKEPGYWVCTSCGKVIGVGPIGYSTRSYSYKPEIKDHANCPRG